MLTVPRRLKPMLFVLIAVFVLAWGVWTFYLVPSSSAPSIPKAETPATQIIP